MILYIILKLFLYLPVENKDLQRKSKLEFGMLVLSTQKKEI